jgi:hypothetical protein
VAFYDTGVLIGGLSQYLNPAYWLQVSFGDRELGLLGLNVYATQGRMILYFVIGVVLGYYGPKILQKMRLYTWGVWPSLGKFEPPK